jgi:hypothetical protein
MGKQKKPGRGSFPGVWTSLEFVLEEPAADAGRTKPIPFPEPRGAPGSGTGGGPPGS